MTRRWLAATCVLALPSTVVAQSGAIRLGVAGVQAERVAPAGTRQLSGMGWTLDGAFGVGPATLTIRYLEGPLELDGGGDAPDLVEGEALLWVAPLRWIAVGGGAHGRAYVQDGSTERWLFWEARVRGTARLVGPALAAYLEGWTVFSSDIDVPEPLDSGRGLEGGLQLVFGRLPLSARLRYRVERLTAGDGARRETEEQVGLAIGIGRR